MTVGKGKPAHVRSDNAGKQDSVCTNLQKGGAQSTVRCDNAGPLACELDGGCASDSARRTCNQCDPSGESFVHLMPPRCAIKG